jgi:TorA maturation chaperone TorD
MIAEEVAISNITGALSLFLVKELDYETIKKLDSLREFLLNAGIDLYNLNVNDLKIEYTDIFIVNIPPYESVFIGPNNRFNDIPAFEVLEHYKKFGYYPKLEGLAVMFPDHAGLELGFLSILFEKIIAEGYSKDLIEGIDEFLTYHILRWFPILYATLKVNYKDSIYTKIIKLAVDVSVEALNYIERVRL